MRPHIFQRASSPFKEQFGGFFGAVLFGLVCACGQTGVRDIRLVQERNLPRPTKILIYDFAVGEQDVREYQGIMRQQPTIKDAATRERLLAQEVKDALANELIGHLKPLGFDIERVERGRKATENDVLIDGQFMTVDE